MTEALGAVDAEAFFSLRNYAVYTLDAAGKVVSWNLGAERILGALASEVIGGSLAQFYTPEQIRTGHPEALLEQAREHGTSVDEGWRVRKDGSWFWANVVTTALWSPEGRLRGYARLTRDDTAAHQQLETSLRQFRDLYELTPVAIGLFDRHGFVIDSNTAMCRLLDRSSRALRETHVTSLLDQDAPEFARLSEAFEEGTPPDGAAAQEWTLLRSDGEQVHCEVHMAKSLQSGGDPFWLVVFEDVTDRRRESQSLRYWAYHDELTGLWNRAAIPQLVADADVERAAVLYCDIKNFNRINEALGYAAGDEVLIAMARRLEEGLPAGWSVARAAADEFVVVCPDVAAEGGVAAIATTVAGLMHASFEVRGRRVQVSALIGAALGSECHGSGEDLVRWAFGSLLRGKKSGHANIAFAGPTLIDSIDGQLELEGELRHAIDNDELSLHYQPTVAADGTILTCESLLRWEHPERGMLSPATILPVAERAGMLADLDAWVLSAALREAATWPASRSGRPVSVSVNVAELMPGYPIFTDLLERLVAETGLPWERIVVELVETAIVDLPDQMRRSMHELRNRGMRFAVDDFGTGYSSLTRIREFPAQVIKIDRTFVTDIAGSHIDRTLVGVVTDMAQSLNCTTVAEGVETREQFDVLRTMPIDAYQGWLFAKALPGPELVQLIEAGPIIP
ncbi:putative bifunctional diguanylate cyclase/phosphodiesterase [Saccharopolyspora tripterygii]